MQLSSDQVTDRGCDVAERFFEKALNESFPWQSWGWGGGHHCPRTVHSWLLVLFCLFLLPLLSTACLLLLTYNLTIVRVSSCVRQWLCPLCLWPRLTWTWIASSLLLPWLWGRLLISCSAERQQHKGWLDRPLSPEKSEFERRRNTFPIPTKSAACDSLESWVSGQRGVTGRVEQSHIAQLAPSVSVLSFSANFLQQSSVSFNQSNSLQCRF